MTKKFCFVADNDWNEEMARAIEEQIIDYVWRAKGLEITIDDIKSYEIMVAVEAKHLFC